MDWLTEISDIDLERLLDNDSHLIFQECGRDVLTSLWQKFGGVNLYIAEKSLYNVKRFYIRQAAAKAAKEGAPLNVKRLAVKLECSEQFVYESLAAADDKGDDPRQEKLL